jgi:hypothetical protein
MTTSVQLLGAQATDPALSSLKERALPRVQEPQMIEKAL